VNPHVSNRELEIYRRGLKDMAEWLAVWRDGEQLVGVQAKPLPQVREEIDRGRWDSVGLATVTREAP